MDVFISHITEESDVAKVLKDWIESTYLGNLEVFVSSDADSIPAGTKWLEEITRAITSSKIILLLCSQNSIHRPWINFEAGCGWAKSIPVIPICYGELTREKLPPPISALQALNLDEKMPELLFSAMNKHLGIAKLPRISFSDMYAELASKTEKLAKNDVLQSNGKTEHAEKTLNLHDEQIQILKFLAKSSDRVTLPIISKGTGINEQRAEYFLEKLEESQHIYVSYSVMNPVTYSLAHLGRELLFDLGEI
ncbi:toll/interleukin-1 receptor domain-containing protein [Vibrio parahaemolyticus]|uniref:toll/interleukin-1 receptor domain-containing protein n=2 Tax=Vibrio parahaemolyticus TaxID=670 RepID=UPI000413E12C|nr:toll/interleukin-1 receptor domain-containing protein [Vibrio parahaemolyticus]EGR3304376.1 toll/interleukin-1 receptor domain-containing protein [Vibrio parahaemolyticus]EGR3320806.1 toll/interleukin-1 receptor domain-containing protein [Vibrio parahaemolyticus]MCX8773814.1 toll/interleukin-1 receptor domain-containing protein [Vibrio parahaemolyticus]TOL91874.1 toll/interleukin-1 receptor domain-containing protein [Vibrio parahaemolyticus]HCH3755132.1 toll/interleukin-1 receptor domain-co